MDNDRPRTQYALPDWETDLAPQVRQVDLLGEISLSRDETQQIGRLLGQFIHSRESWGVSEIIRTIRRTCPCTFALFLVALGSHDESAEDGFWPDVDRATGRPTDANWRSRYGQLFEQILTDQGLSLFPDVTATGFRYVSLILLHGGIPTYALDDYFNYLLKPAMTRADYVGLSTVELIDEWLTYSTGRHVSNRPVRRFLEFGGAVAVDFVERSRELAHDYLEKNLMPPEDQTGLPRRVWRAFHSWATSSQGFSAGDVSPERRSGLRLHKPKIRLDPWGEGLSVDLLPQQIPATLSQATFEWEITLDGQVEARLPMRLRRIGYNLQTPAETLVLERAVADCQIALLLDGRAQRTWSFNLSGPLLIFDPAEHSLLPWRNALPARPLWLLYPQDGELHFTADTVRKIEVLPRLPWGWSIFNGEAWDLSQASRLTLERPNQPALEIPVRADEAAQRPQLVGGTPHRTFTLIKTPLYLGRPPAIRIPLVGRTGLAEELARWRLTVYNPWPAAPHRELRRVPLTELRHLLIEQAGAVEVPLDHPDLLGPAPLGNYTIRLRGPLGRDAELPLRMVPHLALTGHEQIYLPDPHTGPADIELLVETAPDLTLEAQVEETPCQVVPLEAEAERRLYQVTVPPEVTEARLVAVRSQPDGTPIRVPLHVPLRRLRWTLTGDKARVDTQQLQWSGQIVNQSLEALNQLDAPVLFVDLGPPGEGDETKQVSLTLALVEPDGGEIQVRTMTRPLRDPDSVVCRFELAAFMDTLRHHPAPVLRFELSYRSEAIQTRQPLLILTRSMQVDQVAVTLQEKGLTTSVHLTWQEPVWLRHRRVRFWPVWQPWRPSWEKVIPDEAEGEFTFNVAGPDLLVGKYMLEFFVVNPWAGAAPATTPPSDDGPNIAYLELTPAAARLAQLEQGIESLGPRFSLYLEHAFIEAEVGTPQALLADLEQGYAWFEQATLPQILAMAHLVQQTEDTQLLASLRTKMSEADRLEDLLQAVQQGRLSPHQLDAYRDHILRRPGPWPAASCELLQAFPYEPVQIFALMHLIREGAPTGGQLILERVKSHRFSDDDGVGLFEINPDFAAQFLVDHLGESEPRRLLMRLIDREPERDWPVLLVRPGNFARSCAGWGRIETIEALPDGQRLDYFLDSEAGHRLQITLRPSHDEAPVTVEVLADRQRVLFAAALKMYRCTRSKACAFATPDPDLLYHGHNRVAHGGIGTQYEPKASPMISTHPIEYRLRAPQNMLD